MAYLFISDNTYLCMGMQHHGFTALTAACALQHLNEHLSYEDYETIVTLAICDINITTQILKNLKKYKCAVIVLIKGISRDVLLKFDNTMYGSTRISVSTINQVLQKKALERTVKLTPSESRIFNISFLSSAIAIGIPEKKLSYYRMKLKEKFNFESISKVNMENFRQVVFYECYELNTPPKKENAKCLEHLFYDYFSSNLIHPPTSYIT